MYKIVKVIGGRYYSMFEILYKVEYSTEYKSYPPFQTKLLYGLNCKLFCFKDLADAKNFLESDASCEYVNYRIFEIEAENPVKLSDQKIEDYQWLGSLDNFPIGTYLADSIMLIKEIKI
jgi:hypothetical protein